MIEIKQEKSFKDQQHTPISIEETKNILFQMENCICKIYLNNDNIGIRFLCKIPFHNKLLPVLIANNNIFNEKNKNAKIIIKIIINNEEKEIKIDKSRKIYFDDNIIIIEIKPNRDKIYYYLELDENEINNENIEYKSIYILHLYDGKISVSYERINELIDNKEIKYYNPILSLKTFKIIGIYNYQNKNYNIQNLIDKFNEYKNEINIIYKTDEEGEENIFGFKFVKNNYNNIELIINGNKSELISKYKLRKGENNIKIIIKNKITNLESMFYECKSLKNIKELEYLNTKDINNFSNMFSKCSLLSDIKGIENWNVSNGNNFSWMFFDCSSLSDINGLENWNVSNGNDFSNMFFKCSSLSDIKRLEKYNIPYKKYKNII